MQSNRRLELWANHLVPAAVTGVVTGAIVVVALWTIGLPAAPQPTWGSGEPD